MASTAPLCVSLSDPRAKELARVGGKGANLAELTQAGFPVPGGFCVTTEAFRLFVSSAPDLGALLEPLDALTSDDLDGARAYGQRVRQVLASLPMPGEVSSAIGRCLAEHGAEDAYAVRSSATAEDLPDASFAGQQDTYLNIIGLEAVLDAVRRCWVSLYTERAIFYRAQQGLSQGAVELAVVIQRMVPAEASGILFTVDPLSGHRHTLTIEASLGLGEALVGGLVTPDTYWIDKRDDAIGRRQIGHKDTAIVAGWSGGTQQVKPTSDERQRPALTDMQIVALAGLGRRVEAHYGAPQDIEWAVAEGRIWLLQARPITSLYPIKGLRSPDAGLHVYMSMGHQQSMLSAMTPLGLSTFEVVAPIGHAESALSSAYVRVSGGRLFADLTVPLRQRMGRRIMPRLLAQFDAFAPEAIRQVTRRPEFKRQRRTRLWPGALARLLPYGRRVLGALGWRDLAGVVARANTLMDDYIASEAQTLNSVPLGKEQLEAVTRALPGVFGIFLEWVPEAAAGVAATRFLARLSKRWLDAEQVEALTLAIPGNVVQEMNMAIGDLAEMARGSPELVQAFQDLGDDAHDWLDQSAGHAGADAFLSAWDDFLVRYGSRGPSEIDIGQPRWYEDPMPVLRVISSRLRDDAGSLRDHQRLLIENRQAAFGALCASAGKGLFGRLRLRVLARLYQVMTHVGGMREHHKFLLIRYMAVVKEIVKRNAKELVLLGRLAQPEDIWFMTWSDLLAIWDDDATDWGPVIAGRRADLKRQARLKPPVIITSDGEAPMVSPTVQGAPEGALVGTSVSPGIAEGIVRVVRDPHGQMLAPGEILVAAYTDPGWTPLFINAGGLILEIGGTLTHGAIVAREYGIPAIVGVRDATERLVTGQRVRVDGNRGLAELV